MKPGRKPNARPPAREVASLRAAREARDMSQDGLARILGIPYSTLRAWETGRRGPSSEHLSAWRRALGLSVAPAKHRPVFEEDRENE